ncbi:MAG: hypothetical protein ACI8Z1_002470 [Candidatus Azotimanducaceae bacterium]
MAFKHDWSLGGLRVGEARQPTLNDHAIVTSRFLDGSRPAIVGSIERLDASRVITGERIMGVELMMIADISNLPEGTPVEVWFPATRLNQWFGDSAVLSIGSVLTTRDGI